jgi:undecaprenyl-diphosphatase
VDLSEVFQAVDRWTFLLINRTLQNPAFDLVMPVLSDKRVGLVLVLFLVPLLFARYGSQVWPALAVAVIAIALSDQGTGLLKEIFQRPRPCHVLTDIHLLAGCTRTFAMPSNHASNVFVLAGVVWTARIAWRWVVLVLALGIAYSRVYLGVHYPADVIVGAVWGAALGWGLMRGAIWLLPAERLARRNPAASANSLAPDHPSMS